MSVSVESVIPLSFCTVAMIACISLTSQFVYYSCHIGKIYKSSVFACMVLCAMRNATTRQDSLFIIEIQAIIKPNLFINPYRCTSVVVLAFCVVHTKNLLNLFRITNDVPMAKVLTSLNAICDVSNAIRQHIRYAFTNECDMKPSTIIGLNLYLAVL